MLTMGGRRGTSTGRDTRLALWKPSCASTRKINRPLGSVADGKRCRVVVMPTARLFHERPASFENWSEKSSEHPRAARASQLARPAEPYDVRAPSVAGSRTGSGTCGRRRAAQPGKRVRISSSTGRMYSRKRAGFSHMGKCPSPGMARKVAPGTAAASTWPIAGVLDQSYSPVRT
jgi:hypothetical protein